MAGDSASPAAGRERLLEAMNHVLRVAAHDNDLFRRETFETLAHVVAHYAPVDCLAVVVPDPGGERVYAAAGGERGRALPPFGARFPHGPKEEAVLSQSAIKLCDDTRSAELLDPIAVEWGFLSYAIVPIRRRTWTLAMIGEAPRARTEEGAIVGSLVVAFREAGDASKAPLELLNLLSDLFGEAFDRPDSRALRRDDSHVVAAEREAALYFTRVRELEKELRTILDNAPLIIFRLDPQTSALRYLNRHAERLLGIPTSEALDTPEFLRAVHRDRSALRAFDGAVERARAGQVSPPYEARLQWRESNEIAVRGTVYPLRSAGGDVIAIEGILADVSAEYAARARAVQADRLSSLGLLAASVAHEINNPASFILLGLGNMDRLLKGLDVPGDHPSVTSARELVKELRDSIHRVVRIVRDLRVFASPSRDEPSTVIDVNEVVESTLSLARGRIMERAELVRELTEVSPVLMDSGRLGQVIVNLLVNATQAIPKDGSPATITVATRAVGKKVEIHVSDTGSGIPKSDLNRIWAPFFTTKGADIGTGLGLSISRDIVERAGGEIRVESRVDGDPEGPRGSRFVIVLPAADAEPSAIPSPPTSPALPSPRRQILVVEDEVALARVLASELGRHHDVTVAHGAELALEHLSRQRFDVILCDLRMPGMSGEALYATVRENDPAQARAFIFMSGIGFVPEVERFLAASGRPVLHKPFAPLRALELIAQADSAPPPPHLEARPRSTSP